MLLGPSDCDAADVGETEKFKRLARPPTFSLTTSGRRTSKLNEASFLGVKWETELCQPLSQRIEALASF
jgi:hypothetical protein